MVLLLTALFIPCTSSSHLESYLMQPVSHMNLLCSFPLEKYACAKVIIHTALTPKENKPFTMHTVIKCVNDICLFQLENFTAHQLAVLFQCDLPGNSSHSKVLWKMLLTKLSLILDAALDILATMVGDFNKPEIRTGYC